MGARQSSPTSLYHSGVKVESLFDLIKWSLKSSDSWFESCPDAPPFWIFYCVPALHRVHSRQFSVTSGRFDRLCSRSHAGGAPSCWNNSHKLSFPHHTYEIHAVFWKLWLRLALLLILKIFYFLCELDKRVYFGGENYEKFLEVRLLHEEVLVRGLCPGSCVGTMSLGGYNGLHTGHFMFICVFNAV